MKLLLGIKGKGTEFVFRPYDFYENIASKRTLSSKTTNEVFRIMRTYPIIPQRKSKFKLKVTNRGLTIHGFFI